MNAFAKSVQIDRLIILLTLSNEWNLHVKNTLCELQLPILIKNIWIDYENIENMIKISPLL